MIFVDDFTIDFSQLPNIYQIFLTHYRAQLDYNFIQLTKNIRLNTIKLHE